MKKNPLLSMWLSGANRVAGSARSRATAHARRQANAAMTEATRASFKLWSDAVRAATGNPGGRRKR